MGVAPFRLLKRAAQRVWSGPLGRLAKFARWSIPSCWELLFPPAAGERRLLVAYDLATQPFSIGDILSYQAASLVLRDQYRLSAVDFALIYDSRRPACIDPAFGHINNDNVLSHVSSVLAAAQFNPHHGSLFVFDSHKQFRRFVANGDGEYRVWPSAITFAEGKYLFYAIQNEVFYNYFQAHRTFPPLSCRPFLKRWADQFVREHAGSAIPVSIQLRNNPLFGAYRNSLIDVWLEFFQHCQDRYPVRFILIGTRAEVDERIRRHPNVIVAKDHGTSLEQDLALVSASAMHLGASSGPCIMAFFSHKPFLIVNTDIIPERYRGLIVEDGFFRFCFSGALQRLAVGPETVEMLTREFERMYASLRNSALAA